MEDIDLIEGTDDRTAKQAQQFKNEIIENWSKAREHKLAEVKALKALLELNCVSERELYRRFGYTFETARRVCWDWLHEQILLPKSEIL